MLGTTSWITSYEVCWGSSPKCEADPLWTTSYPSNWGKSAWASPATRPEATKECRSLRRRLWGDRLLSIYYYICNCIISYSCTNERVGKLNAAVTTADRSRTVHGIGDPFSREPRRLGFRQLVRECHFEWPQPELETHPLRPPERGLNWQALGPAIQDCGVGLPGGGLEVARR